MSPGGWWGRGRPGGGIAELESTKTEPTKQGTTKAKPTEQGTTEVEPTEQRTTQAEPTEQGTTKAELTEQRTTKAELREQGTTKAKPTEHGTTKVEPTEQRTTKVEQKTTKAGPVELQTMAWERVPRERAQRVQVQPSWPWQRAQISGPASAILTEHTGATENSETVSIVITDSTKHPETASITMTRNTESPETGQKESSERSWVDHSVKVVQEEERRISNCKFIQQTYKKKDNPNGDE